MNLKSKLNNFAGGAFLAADGVLSKLFGDIGRDLFGIDIDSNKVGNSPATSQTAGQLVSNVLQILLLVAGSIAVVYLVIGGIKYVLSRGNEEKVESAKATMGAAIWGLVIIIMSFAIILIISEALLKGAPGTGIQ